MKNKLADILIKPYFVSIFSLVLVLFCLQGAIISTFGQVDANTLLLLKFENSLNGEQGETPTSATGHSFQAGIQGQGALLPNPNQINYLSANNINSTEGTIEFWMKPTWNGNDNQGHFLVRWGGGGGLVLGKDGANNLRVILNRFGTFPGGERGVAVNIGSWTANLWHHVAFTFSNTQKKLRVFIDGTQRAETVFTGDLPSISDSTFQIGGDGAGQYIQSVIDELRISNIARTPQEIANSFISALTITSLTANPNTIQMLPTWWKTPTLQAVTNLGTLTIPPTSVTWTSTNPAVANFDSNRGKIIANSAGTTTLTATINGANANITVNVTAPVLPPMVEQINPFLSTPNVDALWEMPVVIINYLPTTDGVNLNSLVTGETSTLVAMRERINRINLQHKYMLEEGSRFRAFSNSLAKPSLGYRVVSIITVYEELQPLDSTCDVNGACQPDYEQILTRFNGANLVNDLGVKEFWIWGYHHGNIYPVESNMSSPTTGDISNSYRLNDLPVYNKTYLLYNYNFGRSASEATHNHGHQLEAILGYSNQRQDGNDNLFWEKFVGRAPGTRAWQRGRAGDTHHPPNALDDYDYTNTTPFASDIADWNPNGGTTQPVSLPTWRSINYPFPDGVTPPQDDAWWYIYWFQAMPGRSNAIPYNSNRMTNWWQFTGDWDAAVRSSVGLYEASSCNFLLSSSEQTFAGNGGNGSVSLTAGTGCKWFASSNAPWVSVTSGDLGNGNGTVNFTVVPNTSNNPRTTKIIIAGQVFIVTQSINRKPLFDFDGDGKTDISIFRPNVGEWWYQRSSDGQVPAAQFGASTDKITPCDFTGDGKTDLAFWRPSTGFWFILRSEDGSFFSFPFGTSGDIPVPADYDGDGKTDAAVFRPSNSTWFILKSGGGTAIQQFGTNGDKPVVADYDGDGKSDIAIFRPSVGEWWYQKSSNGIVGALQFGSSTDKPIPNDYTGDGKADIAFFRPSTGFWFILRSEDNSFFSFPFGTSGDIPAPGDYDGDGKIDTAVFRPSNSTWFVNRSTAGVGIVTFGIAGDQPVPSAFIP